MSTLVAYFSASGRTKRIADGVCIMRGLNGNTMYHCEIDRIIMSTKCQLNRHKPLEYIE